MPRSPQLVPAVLSLAGPAAGRRRCLASGCPPYWGLYARPGPQNPSYEYRP